MGQRQKLGGGGCVTAFLGFGADLGDAEIPGSHVQARRGPPPRADNYHRQLFRGIPRQRPDEQFHVSSPTLLIWGEQDIALGIELTHGLEQWVDNLHVAYISDSGHWVQQEQPEKVSRLMVDFGQARGARDNIFLFSWLYVTIALPK